MDRIRRRLEPEKQVATATVNVHPLDPAMPWDFRFKEAAADTKFWDEDLHACSTSRTSRASTSSRTRATAWCWTAAPGPWHRTATPCSTTKQDRGGAEGPRRQRQPRRQVERQEFLAVLWPVFQQRQEQGQGEASRRKVQGRRVWPRHLLELEPRPVGLLRRLRRGTVARVRVVPQRQAQELPVPVQAPGLDARCHVKPGLGRRRWFVVRSHPPRTGACRPGEVEMIGRNRLAALYTSCSSQQR